MSFIFQLTEQIPQDLWFTQMSWGSENFDKYNQYFNPDGPAYESFWSLAVVLGEAKKHGNFFRRNIDYDWAPGTVVGIETWWREPHLLQSIQNLKVPPVKQAGDRISIGDTIRPESMVDLGIASLQYLIAVNPVLFAVVELYAALNPTPAEISLYNLNAIPSREKYYFAKKIVLQGSGEFSSPAHLVGDTVPNKKPNAVLVVGFAMREADSPAIVPPPPISLNTYTLHHVIKQGAEISPPDGTVLFEGYSVPIEAWPLGGRTLTSFTVQDVEQLPDASTTNYDDLHADGIDASGVIKDGQAQMTYGPVHSDVYVSAIADAFEISKPCPVTIQLTTNDCLVEAGSWEVVDNNLPAGVTYTLSQDGLMVFSVAEDKWDGIAGGVYFVHVRFNGFKQTKDMKVVVTVSPFPAYGTVWTPVTLLDEDINDIFLASDGKTYIVGQTKIWSTTDLTNFTVETLTGALDTKFGNMGEASTQRICVCDKTGYWIKDVGNGSTEFVRQGNWPAPGGYLAPGYYMSADPDTSEIYVGFGVAYGGVIGVDLDTSSQLGPYQIITGLNGWVSTKGLYNKADDSWIFAGGKTNGYNIVQLKNGVITTVVPSSTAYGNSEPNLYREISGRMIALVEVAQNQLNSMYSDDDGVTWSTPVSFTAATPRRATYLKPGYSVFGGGSHVYRSTDNLASATDVATLDGTFISSFCRLADFKILAGTNGTTYNLYKSEA